MPKFDEYSLLESVAVRRPQEAFVDFIKIGQEWEKLRFYSAPDIDEAIYEHRAFVDIMREKNIMVTNLPGDPKLTLDSIYARDAFIISPKGIILCHMGRASRRGEPKINAEAVSLLGFPILGHIEEPGTVEGGDFIWLNEKTAAVGLGPRTNADGINQLHDLLGRDVELITVPLPPPDHPEDVFHLMSMISPLDKDLALIYKPLMPDSFINWLKRQGIECISLPEAEYKSMGCNVLALGPRDILMLDGLPLTKALLEEHGCTVTTYKGNEISRKGEGGPTCLTRPLIRR